MLKSYEAIYDHGKIEWLSELPDVEQARVIITVLPQQPFVSAEIPKRRRPPEKLIGTARVLGDIVSSPFSEDEWGAMIERTARQIEGDPEAFK